MKDFISHVTDKGPLTKQKAECEPCWRDMPVSAIVQSTPPSPWVPAEDTHPYVYYPFSFVLIFVSFLPLFPSFLLFLYFSFFPLFCLFNLFFFFSPSSFSYLRFFFVFHTLLSFSLTFFKVTV